MAFDQTKPVKTDSFDTGVLASIRANFLALALWMEPSSISYTSLPTGAKRFNESNGLIEKYNGSAWVEQATAYLKNTPASSYGSVQIPGAVSGYVGVQFTGGSKLWTLLIEGSTASESGLYNVTDGVWIWRWSGAGALLAGSVPWARVTSAPAITGETADAAATGSTVAKRTSSGYLFATYFNQSSGNDENPSISQVLVTNGSDGYLRKASLAHVGNSITVPWTQISSRPSDLGSFTNGPGYLTSSSLAGYAALATSPQFTGAVRGNGGTKGFGAITTTTTSGTPSGGSSGDFVFVY